MADEKIITTGSTSPSPETTAAAENLAVNENRTATLRQRARPQDLSPMPGGRRVDARPHMRARYTMQREGDLLGNPEGILSDDWKREHIGWRYQWPIRISSATEAQVRSGWMVPVPAEALNCDNPLAAVSSIKTPNGQYIIWKQHLLVAVPPQYWDLMVTQYEDYAIARTANNADSIAASLEAANPGFAAEVEPFKNAKRAAEEVDVTVLRK